jgi:hypothetical protein
MAEERQRLEPPFRIDPETYVVDLRKFADRHPWVLIHAKDATSLLPRRFSSFACAFGSAHTGDVILDPAGKISWKLLPFTASPNTDEAAQKEEEEARHA